MNYCIVITTCGTLVEAKKLAFQIVKSRLAACVQISRITSYYTWKRKIHNDFEYRLFIKTRTKLYSQLEQYIKDNHSYDVPEIVKLSIQAGFKKYLDWIDEVTD